MAVERSIVRQASPEIRRAVAAGVARAAVRPVPLAHQLQQRLGNHGVQALIARVSGGGAGQGHDGLKVSSPTDPAEREAVAAAKSVMRSATPDVGAGGAHGVQRAGGGHVDAGPDMAQRIERAKIGGAVLPAGLRSFMEGRFGARFGGVRLHTGGEAADLSRALNAHAFTSGQHVFFAANRFRPDTPDGQELIAHELVHTIQQGAGSAGSPVVAREAAGAGEKPGLWSRAKNLVSGAAGFVEGVAWDALGTVAPNLVPIIRDGAGGVLSWLSARVGAAVDGLVNTALAPVRAVSGVGQALSAQFGPMIATMQDAAGKIARNDCSPIKDAATKLESIALKLVTPVVDKLQPVMTKVKAFFTGLWDTMGAPACEWLKTLAGQKWDEIKAVASWIWQATTFMRKFYGDAWTWLKNKIGIGDGPEGENGILQWVQGKVEAAWGVIKTALAPFKNEIVAIGATVGAVAVMLSPAGPVMAVGAAGYAIVQGVRWIAANWGNGALLVRSRDYIQKNLIPSLVSGAQRFQNSVVAMASSIGGALGRLAAGLGRAVGAVAGSALRVLTTAVNWVADQATALAQWAGGALASLTAVVGAALGKLQSFLKGMLDFFAKLGPVLLDVWGLPVLLGQKVWDWIPACIRDPVIDFIGPIILRQIELFEALGRDENAWAKTKTEVHRLIKLVFKDHDLKGAVRAAFDFVLRIFEIPPELLTEIRQKAAASWDVVVKKPLEFIKNTVRSLGHGFKLLWLNIGKHLANGVQGWLFGELKDQNIERPASWTSVSDVFYFALSVMGLSIDHVIVLLKKKFEKQADKIDGIVTWARRFKTVAAWVAGLIDTKKTPAENSQKLVDRGKDFGGTIFTGMAEWIAGKVATELAIMAAAAAASAGLSQVIDTARRIYIAFVSAKRWAKKILQMVSQTLDQVVDIAIGRIEIAGARFRDIMDKGMPVVIGFLADQVGLGDVGAELRRIVQKLRAKVDDAINWFIDVARAAIEFVIGLVQKGVKAVTNWWRKKTSIGGGHELLFVGGKKDARLEAHSPEGMEPDVFTAQFKPTGGETKRVKDLTKEINRVKAKIVKAQNEKTPNEDVIATLDIELTGYFNQLGEVLSALIDRSGEEGSEKNPIPIVYPKRRAGAYPIIYVGPKTEQPLKQDWLKKCAQEGKGKAKSLLDHVPPETKAALLKEDSFKVWGGRVEAYKPTGGKRQLPSGEPVGLSEQFANLQPGRVLMFSEKGGTGGGRKINDLFRPFGYRAQNNVLDGDHVMERQLGGPDHVDNLWPLPASENRSSGATVKGMRHPESGKVLDDVRVKKGGTIYLLIKSVIGG